ncbi:hypothetical protein B0H19DRAFT_1263553 [Mycena capillaripes]|nr:hypothetical protein B0H19DRAFT_1263553 [Mycena capillaripes]
MYAPADLFQLTPLQAELYLPATAHCINLAYVTYAADHAQIPRLGWLCEDLRMSVLFVMVDKYWDSKAGPITRDKERYPNFSTVHLPLSSQVLREWVAKVAGRRSVLEHPALHVVESGQAYDLEIATKLRKVEPRP